MTGFANPWLLAWAAGAVLLTALLGLRWRRRRARAARALGDRALTRRLGPALRGQRTRPVLWTAIAALCGVAAAGPLVGLDREPRVTRLPDVVLVLDASNSMRVRDVAPDRMEVQRRIARSLVRRLGDARVGVAVFAGQGYVVSPLTRDADALDTYLEAMSPEMVPQGGTSLSSALRQGAGLLMTGGALVLISDGDALEERAEVERVAVLLAQAGIPVHAVGVGTAAGGPVPEIDPATGERQGFKQEPDGRTARSALGAPLLRMLAERTGGRYHAASPSTPDEIVAGLPRPDAAARAWNERQPGNRYAWLVAAALLLLAADTLLARRAARSGP